MIHTLNRILPFLPTQITLLKFGFDVIYHTFMPGELTSRGETELNNIIIDKKYAFESGIYVSNEQKFWVTHNA